MLANNDNYNYNNKSTRIKLIFNYCLSLDKATFNSQVVFK